MKAVARLFAAVLVAVFAVAGQPGAQPGSRDSIAVALDVRHMAEAAAALLDSLSPSERVSVLFPVAGEARTNWSNTPPHVHQRPGLRLGAISSEQRVRLHDLLRASMSSQGYQKVAGVMRLDDVHRARTLETMPTDVSDYNRTVNESFGSRNYAFAIFGNPGVDADWGWLLQGHHLGASFTVAGNRVAFLPLFLGAGPLEVDRGDDLGWSAMHKELSLGADLVRSLTAAQLDTAMSAEDPPGDVINGVGHKRDLTPAEGLSAAAMTAEQRTLLRRLVEEYVDNANPTAAAEQLAAIDDAGWDKLSLSWRGGLGGRSEEFYYRIQGERILIECTHQPQHMHSIVRDPANDYGEQWLGLNYLEETSANDHFAASRAQTN
jgi:hypothetical protein